MTVGVIAVVFAHWGLTTKDALDRGIFNFDSLWYHMPFATEMAKSHSVTGLHHTDTVFANWFYPQNSELLHAVGILLTHRDTLSLFLNFGWLAIAFLSAWCIGRPYARGHLAVVAAAILLECHTLVVREPGAAKNDLMAAALLLAAIAILINAWASRENGAEDAADGVLRPGWPLAAAGLAIGLAVGTKSTALAMAAALTLAVVMLAPAGAGPPPPAGGSLAALAGGGYWYLRNLIATGNPLPQVEQPRARPATAPGAPAERAARLQHRPLRDRHRSLERLLRPGPASGVRGALAAGGRRGDRRRPAGPAAGPGAGPALDGRRRPVRHARLPVHAAQRRRRRGGARRLRDQHPLRDPGPARGPGPAARRAPSRRNLAVAGPGRAARSCW